MEVEFAHVTDRAKGSWNVWRIMKTRTSTLFANYPAGNEWYKFISKVYTPPDTITTEPNVNFNKLLSYDGDQLSKHHSLHSVSSKGDKEHSTCCSTRTHIVSRPAPWHGAHQLRLSPRLPLSRILELRLRVQFLKLKNKNFGDLTNSKSISFKEQGGCGAEHGNAGNRQSPMCRPWLHCNEAQLQRLGTVGDPWSWKITGAGPGKGGLLQHCWTQPWMHPQKAVWFDQMNTK